MIISAGKQDIEMRLSVQDRIDAILITLVNHNNSFRLFIDRYCLALDLTFQDFTALRRMELMEYTEKPGDGKSIVGIRCTGDMSYVGNGGHEIRMVPDSGLSEEEILKLLEQFVVLLIMAQYQPATTFTGATF